MDFRTRRVLFSTPLYMIFEFFVLKYLFLLYGGLDDLYTVIIVLILGCMQIVPMLFEKTKSRKLTRFVANIFGIWEWFLVMLFIYLLIVNIAGLFITLPRTVIIMLLAMIMIIGIYAYYNAHRIVVKEKILEFDNLDEEYNIVHLSDVHFGSIRHRQIIDDIKDKINSIDDDCDLVIISGDLADGSCIVEEDDFIALKDVDIPIIFTSGNHDYYPGLESVHKACRNAGIIVLENNVTTYKNLNIYGLSFSFGDIPMPTEAQLRDVIQEDKINIVNYHIPNGWKKLSDIGFDIQLSGHTHGGQFYPVLFFGKYMYEGHNMGLFKERINDMKNHYLHVTTGVGSMDIPMRWGTNSEIVVLKLVKK
jgi:hypothetical protein